MNHDVIVIGGSAGATSVLVPMLAALPAELPASVFIVVHVAPGARTILPELISARGPLSAKHPLHGEKIEPGRIYVAPPDNHLLLESGRMRVVRGPKENGHRPAVDALFRSAALAYGPRVIGVILSGYKDCGTAGMLSIKARGGLSVVQAPESAEASDMPRSVLEHVVADHVVSPNELPDLLARLSSEPAGVPGQPPGAIKQMDGIEPGAPAEIVCPLCHGFLKEATDGRFAHFRCHAGHAFTLESLLEEQNEEVERALWAGVRALEESSMFSLRLSGQSKGELRERFAEQGATQRYNAELIREILLRSGASSSRRAKGDG